MISITSVPVDFCQNHKQIIDYDNLAVNFFSQKFELPEIA